MIDGIVGGDVFPPHGCTVVQVHMMSRHAERYPTTNAGGRTLYRTLLHHLEPLREFPSAHL